MKPTCPQCGHSRLRDRKRTQDFECRYCHSSVPNKKRGRQMRWTTEELKLLRKQWPLEGVQCARLFPYRTLSAIYTRVSVEGLSFSGRRKYPDVWAEKRATPSGGTGIITPRPYLKRVAFGELVRGGK